jgi:hypothetical protein
MPKTYTNNSYAILFEQLLRELDQFQNPGVIVEGIVLCLV